MINVKAGAKKFAPVFALCEYFDDETIFGQSCNFNIKNV